MTYLRCLGARGRRSALTSAWRMRSAWSMSSQKTMVLSIAVGRRAGTAVTFCATSSVALLEDERRGRSRAGCRCGPRSRSPCLSTLALLGAPAGEVLVEVDADDLVGSEEAVLDALLQRVGVDRLAEVVRCSRRTSSPSASRSGRSGWRTRSSRGSRARPSPRAALPRWHSSTTIRSKKSGENCLKMVLCPRSPDDRLVEREVDLVRLVDLCGSVSFVIAPPNGLKSFVLVWSTRMLRSARNRIRFLTPGLPQPPDDLERGVGLAGAGGHHEQDAVLPLGDGLDRRG